VLDQIKKTYQKNKCAKEIDALFSVQNPFFEKGEVRFFSQSESKFVGFWHPDYSFKGRPYVCFGYWQYQNKESFELCLKDLKVWAKSKGVDQILGPIDFSTIHNYRLPLEDAQLRFMGEPHGTTDQNAALKKAGFEPFQQYSSYYIEDPSKIYSWGQKRSQKITKQGAAYRSLSFSEVDFEKRKAEIYSLIDRVFQQNIGYLKPNDFELNFLYHQDKLKRLSQFPFFFVEDGSGKLVGLFVSFLGPDVFSDPSKMCLYFKTIGAEPTDSLHNPVFFFLIHEIYQRYEMMNLKVPICFSLMREGNVAEKVAKMFSDSRRSYALYRLEI